MTQDKGPADAGQDITLDAAKLLDTLVDLACERPGYMYQKPAPRSGRQPACVYTDTEGQPSCLLGHAFARLGCPLPEDPAILDLSYLDEDADEGPTWRSLEDTSISWELVDVVLRQHGPVRSLPRYNHVVWAVLAMVQTKQDNGLTWGEAVKEALDHWSIDVPGRLTRAIQKGGL